MIKEQEKTVVQYFRDKYNYRLTYVFSPCLQAGSDSRPVYLPMEEIHPWTHMMEVPQLHGFGTAAIRLMEAYDTFLKLVGIFSGSFIPCSLQLDSALCPTTQGSQLAQPTPSTPVTITNNQEDSRPNTGFEHGI